MHLQVQQRNELLPAVAGETLDQRGRQAILIDGRHECGRRRPPERARHEGDGSRRTAPKVAALPPRPAASRRPAPDGAEIDLAAEEPERRRRRALATEVHRAAEAQALVGHPTEPNRPAARLASEPRRVQYAATACAPRRARCRRKITVECEEQFVEFGVRQQCSVQGAPSFPLKSTPQWPKPDGMIPVPVAVARNTSAAASR